MAKFLPFVVMLALLGTVRCYSSDPEAIVSGLPFVGSMVEPSSPAPSYVEAIGTPAEGGLPESDLATWFAPPEEKTDPYDVVVWGAVAQFAAHTSTPEHWAEACKLASDAAGPDRTQEPRLGALACSSDSSVTHIQRFAVDILAAQARTALFIKGAPGSSVAAIEARQAEVRLACGFEAVSRLGGADSPYGQACAKALDTSYLSGDAPATFAALGEAYELLAAEVARLDPETDAEPGFFMASAE